MTLTDLSTRIGLGLTGGLVAAYAAFGPTVLSPVQPAFEALLLAAVTTAMLVLVRQGVGEALALIPLYGLMRLVLGGGSAWRVAASAVLVATGAFLVALIYHELAACGIRFGKFLAVGPLLGGVCLAIAPLSEYALLNNYDAFRPLMLPLFTGIVVGDGVGLGVEVAELLPWSEGHEVRGPDTPSATGDETLVGRERRGIEVGK